jgi:hypothetical protein
VLVNANTALPASAYGPQVNNSLGDPFLGKAPTLKHMGLRRDTIRLSGQAGYTFANDWKLDFNSGYNNSDSVAAWDLDRSANLNFQNIQPYLSTDMTVDMRLSTNQQNKVRGLIGASYFRSSVQLSQIDLNAIFGATAYTLNGSNYTSHAEEFRDRCEAEAVRRSPAVHTGVVRLEVEEPHDTHVSV